jgi:hypothetical protein
LRSLNQGGAKRDSTAETLRYKRQTLLSAKAKPCNPTIQAFFDAQTKKTLFFKRQTFFIDRISLYRLPTTP